VSHCHHSATRHVEARSYVCLEAKMGLMPMTGRARGAIFRDAVEEAERIQAQVEPNESEQLRRTRVWRLDQLTGLGFDSAGAALMAHDGQVDLAQARRLIALGCPLGTAARILL
jgi:hypothetical protein